MLEELELVDQGSCSVSLFVGFPDSSLVLPLYRVTEVLPDGCMVYEGDPDFLPRLKEAIAHGGVAIGWYRLRSKETAADTVELGPLQDHQDEPWAYKYLEEWFTLEDKKLTKHKYYLVYPDGHSMDITSRG